MGADRGRAAAALKRATGSLSTTAMARMEQTFAWFPALSAQERSWVGQIVQAGIRAFVDWYHDTRGGQAASPEPDGNHPPGSGATRSFAVAASVFGAAPRALAGTISLHQTVELVRLSIEVVEAEVHRVVAPDDVDDVHAAVLLYAREIAFATAEVYARAAEVRGAWDARLEALVVDAVVRAVSDESGHDGADETMLSRASALGWGERGEVAVVLANLPGRTTEADLFVSVRRLAREAGMDALCAAQGDRLVVVLGNVTDARASAAQLLSLLPDGPVVVGPIAGDLSQAHVSARAATAAMRAATGWPAAPRPVLSSELLPERALSGDADAARFLVEEVFAPLDTGRGDLVGTLEAYFAQAGSIEATGRALFVHANTVRYRLRQVGVLTGFSPTDARDALALQMALILGRQASPSAYL